ncbi:MAG: outer-membrane lipoprotein carrier protein LolA [Methylovirgula sp.]|uniref:LolA family protein n=1 Tax=Methylovirgula sp. TaxID=1978224 RepID=UPI00307660B1
MRLNFVRAGVSGLFLGSAMAFATFATMTFAEAATAAATPPPVSQNSAPPPAATPPFKPMDPHVAIQKADDYFNSTRSMIGDFVQISGDRRSEGKVYIQKPGKMRFEYAEPATLDIVADGMTVAVIDRKLATQDFYFVWQTPLKFLLKDRIDLLRDLAVTDVISDPDNVTITVVDQETFGGTSRIKLMFDPASFQLKQWEVTDPQGNETLVSLFNVDRSTPPDPSVFQIKSSRLDSSNSRLLNRSN